MKRIRNHITSAHVIAMLALFVAMGGTGYAALKLPKNSVGSKQIKKNAVNSSKVKNGSLKAVDFKAGQLPAGPAGPRGTTGATGAPGPQGEATGYARVESTGAVLDTTNPKNVASTNIQHAAPGVYCFGGLSFQPQAAVVSADNAQDTNTLVVVSSAVQRQGITVNQCDADHQQARVNVNQPTYSGTGPSVVATPTDHRFDIWFEK